MNMLLCITPQTLWLYENHSKKKKKQPTNSCTMVLSSPSHSDWSEFPFLACLKSETLFVCKWLQWNMHGGFVQLSSVCGCTVQSWRRFKVLSKEAPELSLLENGTWLFCNKKPSNTLWKLLLGQPDVDWSEIWLCYVTASGAISGGQQSRVCCAQLKHKSITTSRSSNIRRSKSFAYNNLWNACG